MRLKIKPMSINECWQGRRFKTKEYKVYRDALLWMLPTKKLPPPPYSIEITFGFSNKASDIDNPVKPLFDSLKDKYKGFDDRDVYRLEVRKVIVPKGEEFIEVEIFSEIIPGTEFKLG